MANFDVHGRDQVRRHGWFSALFLLAPQPKMTRVGMTEPDNCGKGFGEKETLNARPDKKERSIDRDW